MMANLGKEKVRVETRLNAAAECGLQLAFAGLDSINDAFHSLSVDGASPANGILAIRMNGLRIIPDPLEKGCRTGDEDQELRHVNARVFAEVLVENTRLRKEVRRLQSDLAHIGVIATEELAASLAHEVKQPIAAAVLNARVCLRWLKHDPPDLAHACEAVVRMIDDMKRIANIVDRVRALYTQERSKREPVDVNEIIREVSALLGDQASRNSVSVQAELDPKLPIIRADSVQLQQVLINLMVNGIEAMRDTAGELTVTSKSTDGQVLIGVSDLGIGLPGEGTEHIFEAFFTTKPDGTGLGLSISRTIIELHGGRLWASANAGRGATFQFTLPTR